MGKPEISAKNTLNGSKILQKNHEPINQHIPPTLKIIPKISKKLNNNTNQLFATSSCDPPTSKEILSSVMNRISRSYIIIYVHET